MKLIYYTDGNTACIKLLNFFLLTFQCIHKVIVFIRAEKKNQKLLKISLNSKQCISVYIKYDLTEAQTKPTLLTLFPLTNTKTYIHSNKIEKANHTHV